MEPWYVRITLDGLHQKEVAIVQKLVDMEVRDVQHADLVDLIVVVATATAIVIVILIVVAVFVDWRCGMCNMLTWLT